MRLCLDRAVLVRILAGDIECCVLGQEIFTLRVPLSTQVYKWVSANLILKGGQLEGVGGRGRSLFVARVNFESRVKFESRVRFESGISNFFSVFFFFFPITLMI